LSGRWIGHTYRLNGEKTLSVITAYRSCKQSTIESESVITASHQQQSLIFDDTGKHMEPRQAFMDDLLTLTQTIEKDPGNSVILMWDANESLDNTTGAHRKLLRETTLVDTFSHIAGCTCDISTYPFMGRGTRVALK
jgi:hypothetical protein